MEVIIGTPIQELLDFCGGLTAEPGKILYGGPMMGTCVADLSQPILKNNNAILAFSEERANAAQGQQLHPAAAAASTPVPWGWPPRTSSMAYQQGQCGAAEPAACRPVHGLRHLLLCLPRQAAV